MQSSDLRLYLDNADMVCIEEKPPSIHELDDLMYECLTTVEFHLNT